MNSETNFKLIENMFCNKILFENKDKINDYEVSVCEDYDNLNLYECSKKINSLIDEENCIKQLSLIEIRNTLFDSYLEISLIDRKNEFTWTEKIIYNNKNYNIQKFKKTKDSLFCYSDIDLDDDSFDYVWINNPYTFIYLKNKTLYLKTAFEISNTYQKEILTNFLQCLDKLELALSS